MKTCNSCAKEKHSSEFHKRKASKDGLAAKCRDCQREYDKARANLPHRVEARKEYQKTNAYKESHLKANRKYSKLHGYENTKKYRERNEKKYKVHGLVAYAIKTGILTRKPCEICGLNNAVGHHDDYDKPLDVRWLCPQHHADWHKKNGEALNAS